MPETDQALALQTTKNPQIHPKNTHTHKHTHHGTCVGRWSDYHKWSHAERCHEIARNRLRREVERERATDFRGTYYPTRHVTGNNTHATHHHKRAHRSCVVTRVSIRKSEIYACQTGGAARPTADRCRNPPPHRYITTPSALKYTGETGVLCPIEIYDYCVRTRVKRTHAFDCR